MLTRYELLPCPFCGSEVIPMEEPEENCWYIYCSVCTCRFGGYSSRLEMIPAWNLRYIPPPQPTETTGTWQPIAQSLEYNLVTLAIHGGEIPAEYRMCRLAQTAAEEGEEEATDENV